MNQVRLRDLEQDEPAGIAATDTSESVPSPELEDIRADLAVEFEEAFSTELLVRVDAMRAALHRIAGGVTATEREQLLGSILRHAHSLKGAAQVVGRARLAAVAGALETRLRTSPDDQEAACAGVAAIARVAESLGLTIPELRLPGSPPTPPAAPAIHMEPPLAPSVPHRLRILHVEDGPVNRALVRAIFSRSSVPLVRDCELLEVESLGDARAILRSCSVDIVLLDLRLPDGDGLELARELSASARRPTPVVVISASVLPTERRAALAAGADVFIGKPVDPARLVASVAALAAAHPGHVS